MNGLVLLALLVGSANAYSELFIGRFKISRVEEDVPTINGQTLLKTFYEVERGQTPEDLYFTTPVAEKFHIFLNKDRELPKSGTSNEIAIYGEEITPTCLLMKSDQVTFELDVDRKNLVFVSTDDGNNTVITAKRT